MFLNLTKETCTGTGNTLTLAGATTGMNAFGKTGNGVDGALYSCVVDDADGTTHVAGIYTFNKTANTLTRNDTWNTTATAVDNNPATNIALSAGTHTVRCDVVTNGLFSAGKNSITSGTSASQWNIPHNILGELSQLTSIANTICTTLVRFHSPTIISQICVSVYVADPAITLWRRGIYLPDNNGQPSKLLIDFGNNATDGATTGYKNTTVSQIVLPPGIYYFASVTDSAVLQYKAPGYAEVVGGNTEHWNNNRYNSHQMSGVTGALPSVFVETGKGFNTQAPVGFK